MKQKKKTDVQVTILEFYSELEVKNKLVPVPVPKRHVIKKYG
jgi:hypothetical protein